MGTELQKSFGGHWSDEKLAALKAYLQSYCTALKKSRFELVYIDAFAGSGRRELEFGESDSQELFDEPAVLQDDATYRHGSPLLALECEPPFSRFVFVDRNEQSLNELERQIKESGHLRGRPASFIPGDANHILQEIAAKDWSASRAVAFLDPFALHVTWATIQAIAKTQAIDMWLLFPAMAVNRMLPRSGVVPEAWADRLTETFGNNDWRDVFYRKEQTDLFGETNIAKTPKVFSKLGEHVTNRLASEFAGVHEQPLILRNTSGAPIFLLCFASGNPVGAPIATRIAQHIINKQAHGR